ncbi:hypothetical protein HRbin20_00170 [bacterium HR20]|nr:hypothetical protein HRbin20_00170 [bacterium HR20]
MEQPPCCQKAACPFPARGRGTLTTLGVAARDYFSMMIGTVSV